METRLSAGLLKLLVIVAVGIAAYLWRERLRGRAIAAGRKTAPVPKTSGGGAAGGTPEQGALTCPVCRSVLPERCPWSDTIVCHQCWTRVRYSSLLPAASRAIDFETPPPGARLERLADGFTIAVSMRSWLAILTAPCGLLVLGLGGWLLASGMKTPPPGRVPVFGPLELLGISVLAAAVAALCLVPIAGQLRITRHGECLTVFKGVGTVGWTSEYRWSSFRTVYEELQGSGGRMGYDRVVVLDGERRVTFGSLLADKRRDFVLQALRAMLAEKQGTAALATPLS